MKRALLFTSFFLIAACGGRIDSSSSPGSSHDRTGGTPNGPPSSDDDSSGSGYYPAYKSCSVSLSAFCANDQTTYPTPPVWTGSCPASMAAAENPSAWCVAGDDTSRITVETCGAYTAVVYSGVDNEIWFYYDASSTLVAVTYNDPDGDTCYGGPAGFVRPDLSTCTWGPDLCSESADAGTD